MDDAAIAPARVRAPLAHGRWLRNASDVQRTIPRDAQVLRYAFDRLRALGAEFSPEPGSNVSALGPLKESDAHSHADVGRPFT